MNKINKLIGSCRLSCKYVCFKLFVLVFLFSFIHQKKVFFPTWIYLIWTNTDKMIKIITVYLDLLFLRYFNVCHQLCLRSKSEQFVIRSSVGVFLLLASRWQHTKA